MKSREAGGLDPAVTIFLLLTLFAEQAAAVVTCFLPLVSWWKCPSDVRIQPAAFGDKEPASSPSCLWASFRLNVCCMLCVLQSLGAVGKKKGEGSSKDKKSCKVSFPQQELRKRLTPQQYHVTQEKGTESPFTGEYTLYKEKGKYNCVVCATPLFTSKTKFDSGSGCLFPGLHCLFQPSPGHNVLLGHQHVRTSVITDSTSGCISTLGKVGHPSTMCWILMQ
ncbi:methionine-R-sulfoxide reductase B3 isoform X3 [Narcine bancroftii]|uniref:methionine-R-sulfoxide reductase B3 isoform X3 n=1 Tax=Narcine bancroftii TaxID=1343680 RepID=UPI00383103BF